jgi:hypothetical protein
LNIIFNIKLSFTSTFRFTVYSGVLAALITE